MFDTDDAGKSFLQHMKGKDHYSLVSYANLIYSGMAQIPVPKTRVEEFKLDLLPYVSKCELCGNPVPMRPSNGCELSCTGCQDLLEDVILRAQANYALYKDHGFCCLALEGLEYRRGF